jgi:hypothetical protein
MKTEYVLQAHNSPTSPSFPHAFSGNPGGIRTGPPIKTFGGDGLGRLISSTQPQFSQEHTKVTKLPHLLLLPRFAGEERGGGEANAKCQWRWARFIAPSEITFVNFVFFVVRTVQSRPPMPGFDPIGIASTIIPSGARNLTAFPGSLMTLHPYLPTSAMQFSTLSTSMPK